MFVLFAEAGNVWNFGRRMDRWHLLHSIDRRKFEHNFVCLSNVRVLVRDCNWIFELCRVLSIRTTEKSTKQRPNQMESSIHCKHYDILFEQLSWSISQYNDYHDIHLLLPINADTQSERVLVSRMNISIYSIWMYWLNLID